MEDRGQSHSFETAFQNGLRRQCGGGLQGGMEFFLAQNADRGRAQQVSSEKGVRVPGLP